MVGADPLDDPIEDRGLDHLAEGEFDVEGGEVILERDQLFAARRFVDPVHDRRLLSLQRLGRGDVGGDHKVLDQPVRVQPLARRDRHDAALLVEHHPAFGKVELQWLALVSRRQQRAPAGPQGLQRLVDQLAWHRPFERWHRAGRGSHFNDFLARRVHRGLCILICNVCSNANLGTRESPAFQRSVLADMEVARQRGADLRLPSANRCPTTARAAASARRGRGNRRCCRAPAPRLSSSEPGRT